MHNAQQFLYIFPFVEFSDCCYIVLYFPIHDALSLRFPGGFR